MFHDFPRKLRLRHNEKESIPCFDVPLTLFVCTFSKVAKGVKKRWAAVAHLAASMLSPYLVESAEVDSSDHAHNSGQHNHRSPSSDYSSGDVEIDIDLRKQSPRMDLHYSRKGDASEERHFHDIDLSLLPSFLVPEPVSGRISPLQKIQRFLGFSGKMLFMFNEPWC